MLVWGGTSTLVIVGLLNGACGSAPQAGHCWSPGVCHDVSSSSSCGSNESFSEGVCSSSLRVGACVAANGDRVYLYAPLHGLLAPDCARFVGLGGHYVPD